MTVSVCPCFSLGVEQHRAFDRFVILDWYDGVVEGLVRCDSCAAWYLSRLVAWSITDNLRLYALRPLSARQIDSILRTLGQNPVWPKWSPRFDEHLSRELENTLDSIERFPLHKVTLVAGGSLDGALLAVRVVSDEVALHICRQRPNIEKIADQNRSTREHLFSLLGLEIPSDGDS